MLQTHRKFRIKYDSQIPDLVGHLRFVSLNTGVQVPWEAAGVEVLQLKPSLICIVVLHIQLSKMFKPEFHTDSWEVMWYLLSQLQVDLCIISVCMMQEIRGRNRLKRGSKINTEKKWMSRGVLFLCLVMQVLKGRSQRVGFLGTT